MKYFVKKIIEPDFGCEGRLENDIIKDKVVLRDENGQEIEREVPDAELYEKHIDEGDWVSFDASGEMKKEV